MYLYYQLRPKHTCGGCFLRTKKNDYTVIIQFLKYQSVYYNANYMKYVMYRPKWCMIEQMQKKYIPIGSLVGNDIRPPTTITQLWAQPSGVGLQQKRSWSPRHLNVCLWSTWRSQICICGSLILRWCDMYTAVYIRLPFFNAPKMIFHDISAFRWNSVFLRCLGEKDWCWFNLMIIDSCIQVPRIFRSLAVHVPVACGIIWVVSEITFESLRT